MSGTLTRDEAWALANELVDAGISCSVNIGVAHEMQEWCNVHIPGVGLGTKIRQALDIAEKHGCVPTFTLDNGITLFKQ